MEEQESSEIAHMVYNYLLEVHLFDVAKMFFNTSPHLTLEQELQIDKIPFSNAMRRISHVMHEFNDLQQQMHKLIWKYGKNVRFPPKLSIWEKVQYLVDYLYTCKMSAPATNPTESTTENNVEYVQNFNLSMENLPLNNNVNIGTFEPARTATDWQQSTTSTYAYQDPFVYSNEQHQGNPIVYHVNDDGTLTLPSGSVVERTTEEPLRMCYVLEEDGRKAIQITSNILLAPGREEVEPHTDKVHHTEEQFMLQPAVFDESQMEVGQLVEIGSTDTVQHPAQQQYNPVEIYPMEQLPIANISEPQQAPQLSPEVSKGSGSLCAPLLEEGNYENISIVANLPAPEMSDTVGTVKQDQSAPSTGSAKLVPNLTEQSKQQHNSSVKQQSNEEALVEWNRIRAVNKSNFDNFAREVNCKVEIQERLEMVLQKKLARKLRAKALSAGKLTASIKKRPREEDPQQMEKLNVAKKAQPTGKVKATVRVTEGKRKCDNGVEQIHGMQKPWQSTACGLSDSSDSACSVEDDDSIRQMTENVKRYRKQRLQQSSATTASKMSITEEKVIQSNNDSITHIASQSPTKCTVDASPSKDLATVRKIAPAKIARTVRTPAKPKQQSVPTTVRVGTPRQQQLRAKKLAEAAEIVKEENVYDTPMIVWPALSLGEINTPAKANTVAAETSPTEYRRSARICTTTRQSNEEPDNRKSKSNEKSPKKTTTPRKRTIPIMENKGAADPATMKQIADSRATDNDLEPPPPAEGDVAEAAIYAVLAQLHGN